jgi:ATP-dependent helicase/nuclease subunit A
VAHHLFLQRVSLEKVGTLEDLRLEARRLVQLRVLSEQDAGLLDLEAITAFWNSSVGKEILVQKELLKRELAFSMRLSAEDIPEFPFLKPIPAGEFVIVQGVADLAVLRPQDIWILDFKTDHVSELELEARAAVYTPQLQLYGLALSRIYGKPVTHHWLHFLSCGKTVEIQPHCKTLT